MEQPAEHSTPWCVVCTYHGHVALTEREFGAQSADVERDWYCPRCTCVSQFDQAHYDASREAAFAELRESIEPIPPALNVATSYTFASGLVVTIERDHTDDDWIVRSSVTGRMAIATGESIETALVAALGFVLSRITPTPEVVDAPEA